MRKKILIAEASDTTRGVAENVLRQNGFDVISVATGEKTLEVLELSKPHLIMVDSTLVFKGKKTLFHRLQEDARTQSIPFLLIIDEGDSDSSPFPDEVKITRPLDPQDMLTKVKVMAGSDQDSGSEEEDDRNPLGSSLEEDLLDEALGLDRIDVTDSEVMDAVTTTKKKPKSEPEGEKLIGMEHDHQEEEESGKNKVESLRIDDASSEIAPKGDDKDSSNAGQLEILSEHEQFGIGDASLLETSDEYADHDYEWFINEMKKDASGAGKKHAQPPTGQDSKTPSSAPGPSKSRGEGVEKFIEEFKKEIKSFSDSASPAKSAAKPAPKPAATATKPEPQAEPVSTPERVNVSEVELLTKELVHSLALKIAEKIANKIDPNKLLFLIKNEIMESSKK
jgi:DNA-binding response OmpR family regulator